MNTDFFNGVKQWELDWDGMKGKLPCFYYDTTSLMAIYTASTAKVRNLLPRHEMHPVEVFPGRCLAGFSAFEYRDTDLGPYNEFAVAFIVTYGKPQIPTVTVGWQMARRTVSAYIWQLPVTTEIARKGGVDMFGYPKFIADITFQRDNGWISCDLSVAGERILTLNGKTLPARQDKVNRYITYSVLDHVPMRTNVFINPVEMTQVMDKQAAALDLGNHDIAETIKDLELSKSPVTYQYSPKNQAILFPARNLMDD